MFGIEYGDIYEERTKRYLLQILLVGTFQGIKTLSERGLQFYGVFNGVNRDT